MNMFLANKEKDYVGYEFSQLFNIDEIQKIQDAFSQANGVASIITEVDGTPITKPSGFSGFCECVIRKTELGMKNCIKSDSIIGSPKIDGPRVQRCLSSGLLDAGASIMVGDRHIANWLIGQVFDDGIKIEDMLGYCDEIGANRDEYILALKKVTHMSYEKFDSICNFLFLNARMLSSLAMQNMMQKEEISKRIVLEKDLSKEKEFFEVTIASIGDAVITTDNYANITMLNMVAEKILRCQSKEVVGKPLMEIFKIVNKKTMRRIQNPVNRVLKSKNIVTSPKNTLLILRNDKKINISGTAAPIKDENGNIHGVVIAFRDVTEEEKKRDNIEYLSYHDSLTKLYNRTYAEKLINKYKKSEYFPFSIIAGDVNSLKLTNDIFGNYEGDRLLKKIACIMQCSCRENDIVARWGGDEFLVFLPNTNIIEAEQICNKIRENCLLVDDLKIIPSVALGVASKKNNKDDLLSVIKIAESRMYKNKLLEINSARSGIVASLKSTMLEKSYETEEHALRIEKWSVEIARELGISESDIDNLKLAAVLHDIGKVAISDKILEKPGALDAREWAEMKRHSEIGFRIAKSSNEIAHVAEYILYHHERWDGTGYPKGKSREEIPIISRIISIVDSYDAMTNSRAYKTAMTKEDAIEEISRCSGKQFDPDIVDIFVKLLISDK